MVLDLFITLFINRLKEVKMYSYTQLNEKGISEEGYVTGLIYVFCKDETTYLGFRKDGKESFILTDKGDLEKMIEFSNYLKENKNS